MNHLVHWIRIKYTALKSGIVNKVCNLGFASFFMNVTESIVQAVFFQQLLNYGNSNHVAALSIMFSGVQLGIQETFRAVGYGKTAIFNRQLRNS